MYCICHWFVCFTHRNWASALHWTLLLNKYLYIQSIHYMKVFFRVKWMNQHKLTQNSFNAYSISCKTFVFCVLSFAFLFCLVFLLFFFFIFIVGSVLEKKIIFFVVYRTYLKVISVELSCGSSIMQRFFWFQIVNWFTRVANRYCRFHFVSQKN